MINLKKNIKVLVVDDSAVVRKVFTEELSHERGGKHAMDALSLGAAEVISKPSAAYSVGDMSIKLADKIRAVASLKTRPIAQSTKTSETAKPELASKAIAVTTNKIIAIGAATGGTEAIKTVLLGMPQNSPGIVFVQHMPAKFTTSFAERLDSLCAVNVKEARDGDSVASGKALIAPGNYHILLKRSGARYYVQVKTEPLVHHQRPAVDVLFRSVADFAGANAVGVILTGMGADGASGLLKMKEAGAKTIAQDEKSCVVFGMPKEAIKLEAVDKVVSLQSIAKTSLEMIV